MREEGFRTYLENAESIESKAKAVNTRVSRANTIEDVLKMDLDAVVCSDEKMYDALAILKKHPKEGNGRLQNALRWYYRFANGREFPRLSTYKR